MNYRTFMPAAEPVVDGGFSQVDEHTAAGRVLVYIETDDIERSFARIEANAGKRMEPPVEIPGVGAIATFLAPASKLMAPKARRGHVTGDRARGAIDLTAPGARPRPVDQESRRFGSLQTMVYAGSNTLPRS
jgi:hypothetical protein